MSSALTPEPIRVDLTLSLSASGSSDPIDISEHQNVAIQLTTVTSDAAGALKLQGSVDGTVWNDMTPNSGSLADLAASSNPSRNADVLFIPSPLIRVTYTRTSGTGTMAIAAWLKP